MTDEEIAQVCHEANRAYCLACGDTSQSLWEEAPKWQKDSSISGVRFYRDRPNESASSGHNYWLALKYAQGWTYGPVKDAIKKEHPCCVSYDELPEEQKRKDILFKAIVGALSP
jgi:RyR domain